VRQAGTFILVEASCPAGSDAGAKLLDEPFRSVHRMGKHD
jgi:hypothetical protein